MTRRSITALALAITLGLPAPALARAPRRPAAPPAPTPPVASDVEPIADEVEALRALRFLRSVPVARRSAAEARAALAKELDEQLPPERAEARARLLAELELLPRDFPLRDRLLGLLAEQVAGFYVPRRGELVVVQRPATGAAAGATDPVDATAAVLAHELGHALADQHYDLDALIDQDAFRDRDDLLLARQALAEGDATLLMMLFAFRRMGVPPGPDTFPSGDMLRGVLQDLGPASYPELQNAPPFLREQLLEPYLLGMEFVVAAWKRGGWPAVDREWRDPPSSTEQLLHPARRHDPPKAVRAPALPAGWTVRATAEFGELGVRGWLATRLPAGDAAAAAEGWGGDRVLLLERPAPPPVRRGAPAHHVAVVLATEWDAPAEADGFAAAAERWLRLSLTPEDEWRIERSGTSVEVFFQRKPAPVDLIDDDPWERPASDLSGGKDRK